MEKAVVRDVLRALARRKYELTDDGRLYVPSSRLYVGGCFEVQHLRDGDLIGVDFGKNLLVDQGLNHLLNVVFNAQTQTTTWYVGIFEGNYTPVAGDTMSTFPTNAVECTAYDEASRPAYNEAASTAKSITNSASPADFTINATKTVYGAFLSSVSTKGGTTGVLMAAARFGTARSVVDNDVLRITYTVNASSS